MPIKDDLSSLAEKAKWKTNQQKRLLNIHNEINRKESLIKVQKANLAETTYRLFSNNELTDEKVINLCLEIQATYNEIDEFKAQEEAARNEKPPENLSHYSPAFPASPLVCPVDGRELRGKFCPEHGVAGIVKAATASTAVNPAMLTGLVCPVCGRELVSPFCPEHGAAGVPRVVSETPVMEELPVSDSTRVVLVCPICREPLAGRFCNQHGVEGVPLEQAG